ncbi:MAG: hypothetical protein E5V25_26555 [Mesorhizobium sp.]|nr:MAG: hypothetical protein E5V25_26555 [Mesorhizobium sp.]
MTEATQLPEPVLDKKAFVAAVTAARKWDSFIHQGPIEAAISAYLAALGTQPVPVAVKPRRTFPILNGGGQKIDWQLVADHSTQAKRNHYQTVERLAERGGLSWCEL